jgi:hypothetical protein
VAGGVVEKPDGASVAAGSVGRMRRQILSVLTGVLAIVLGVAVQEQWPDQAAIMWVAVAFILLAIGLLLAWPQVLAFIGAQLAPEISKHLPNPPATSVGPTSAYEDPEVPRLRQLVSTLRTILGEAQEKRAEMSHAAFWLNEPQASDRFDYYGWRATVRQRLIALSPTDAGHFTQPPTGSEYMEDEYGTEHEVTQGSPNRDTLDFLSVDIDRLERLLAFYEIQLRNATH